MHALSAELDYEEGRSAFELTLLPDVFFLTSVELDFTMVAVAASELRGRAPIPLREGLTIEPNTGQPGPGARSTRCDHAPPTPPSPWPPPPRCMPWLPPTEPVLVVVTAYHRCGGA